MTKEQVIAEAARRSELTQREIRKSLNVVIEVMVEAFENDTSIAIAGLGTFQVKKRGQVMKLLPENGKGPAKGEAGKRALFVIGEKRSIKFNPAPYINLDYSGQSSSPTKTEKEEPK